MPSLPPPQLDHPTSAIPLILLFTHLHQKRIPSPQRSNTSTKDLPFSNTSFLSIWYQPLTILIINPNHEDLEYPFPLLISDHSARPLGFAIPSPSNWTFFSTKGSAIQLPSQWSFISTKGSAIPLSFSVILHLKQRIWSLIYQPYGSAISLSLNPYLDNKDLPSPSPSHWSPISTIRICHPPLPLTDPLSHT